MLANTKCKTTDIWDPLGPQTRSIPCDPQHSQCSDQSLEMALYSDWPIAELTIFPEMSFIKYLKFI